MKFLISCLIFSISSLLFSGELERDLNQKGVKIEKGSRLILNQKLNKLGKKKGDRYIVEFLCKHKNKFDSCRVSKVRH